MVMGTPWGWNIAETGCAGFKSGAAGALGSTGPFEIELPFFIDVIAAVSVAGGIALATGAPTNGSGVNPNAFELRSGMGMWKCELMAYILAIWAASWLSSKPRTNESPSTAEVFSVMREQSGMLHRTYLETGPPRPLHHRSARA